MSKKNVSILLIISIVLALCATGFYANTSKSLTYTQYFSETREFKDESVGYGYDNYLNYLGLEWVYRQNLTTYKCEVLLQEKVSYIYEYKYKIYYVINEDQIATTDRDGNNLTVIYEAEAPILNLFANDDLIFFQTGKTVYRYHMPSKTLDKIMTSDYLESYKPVSNNSVIWYSSEKLSLESSKSDSHGCGDEAYETYIYDIKNKVNQIYVEPEFVSENSLGSESLPANATAAAAASVTVNGKTLPKTGWTDGKYYNTTANNASPCTCHNTNNTCTCIYYTRNGKNASQCLAFGYEIYEYLWGNLNTQYTINRDLGSTSSQIEARLKKLINAVGAGAHIRTQKPDGNYHSFITASVSTSSFVIYEANYGGACEINYNTLSYSSYYSNYKGYYVEWVAVPSHSCGSYCIVVVSPTQHKCDITGTISNHAFTCPYCYGI